MIRQSCSALVFGKVPSTVLSTSITGESEAPGKFTDSIQSAAMPRLLVCAH